MTRWAWLSYVYAAAVVCALGYCLIDVPVQVSDSYGNIVQAAGGTLASVVASQFHARAFLRPFLWAHIRVVYDLSGGHYFEWFRGWHVAQVAVLVLLFLRLLRPHRVVDAAAVPIGLAALIGMHTFAGTVREAFPINAYMTILICCFLAADLALGTPRWWRDVAAAALFVFAVLSVESGLLVAVVFAAAFAAGARGVSRRGLVAIGALVAGYFLLRFVILDVGTPALSERSSGFGFSSREPEDLIAMFGGSAIPFYAYNVLSSALSVLFSEPRGGVWVATRGIVRGELSFMSIVNVVASSLAVVTLAIHVWRRRGEWWARRFDRGDQLLIVFAAVLLANSAISYAYTKDVILSPAGAFFGCALAVAVVGLLDIAATATARQRGMVALLLVALSTTWGIRAVSAHLGLRRSAAAIRTEWAIVDEWLEREHLVPSTPLAARLKNELRDQAITKHPARPALTASWVERLVDD